MAASSRSFQLGVLKDEVRFQCDAYLRADAARVAALANLSTGQDDFWFAVQAQLGAAACISKLCWYGGKKKEPASYTAIRRALRTELAMTLSSPLYARTVRNDLEHIDERLLKHMDQNSFVLARFMGSPTMLGAMAGAVFRQYDPATELVHFLTHQVSLIDMTAEIRRVCALV